MTRFVVDASVAIKWFVQETDSDRALELIAPQHVLLAPDLLLLEVTGLLSRRVREGTVKRSDAHSDMTELPSFFASFTPSTVLAVAAFELSLTIGHPLYDCIYLALAIEQAAPIVTADAKFVQRLAGTPFAKDVVLLGDWTG